MAGPLVPWSSGPLVRWSFGPLVLVRWSPAVRWSTGPLVPWSSGPSSFFLSFVSFFLSSFFFAAVLLSLFCFCFSFCSLCRDEAKQGSKQASKEASKQASTSCSGGAAPPQPPPRHEICTSSPTPAPATKSIFYGELPGAKFSNQANMPPLSLYLSIYLSTYLPIYLSIYRSILSFYLSIAILAQVPMTSLHRTLSKTQLQCGICAFSLFVVACCFCFTSVSSVLPQTFRLFIKQICIFLVHLSAQQRGQTLSFIFKHQTFLFVEHLNTNSNPLWLIYLQTMRDPLQLSLIRQPDLTHRLAQHLQHPNAAPRPCKQPAVCAGNTAAKRT